MCKIKMSDSDPESFDVLIIGGGVSGLCSAYKLMQKDPSLNVLIVESSSRFGGKLYKCSLGEMGGKWITEDQYHIYNLLRDLSISIKKRSIVSPNLQRCWDIDRGIFAFICRFELKRFIAEIDIKSETFRPGKYKICNKGITMEKFITSKLLLERSRNFMSVIVRLVAGVEPKDVTYVEFMSICYSCGGLSMLITLYTGNSENLLEFSSDDLLQAILSNIRNSYFRDRTKIIEIRHTNNYVLAFDSIGNTFKAAVLILAIPWYEVTQINIQPPLPLELRIPTMDNRSMITSFLIQYEEGYWRRHKYSGSYYCENPTLIATEYNPSTLVGLLLHDDGFEMLAPPIVLEKLSEHFGPEMRLPMQYEQKTYDQSINLNLPPTTPWNRLIWSSSYTATSYRGCLSGAVQSGFRAAINSLFILKPQNVTWQDLSEIQTANAVYRKVGWWNLTVCSINVYNSLSVCFSALLVCILLKTRHKLFSS